MLFLVNNGALIIQVVWFIISVSIIFFSFAPFGFASGGRDHKGQAVRF
jgi:hypothetical protein